MPGQNFFLNNCQSSWYKFIQDFNVRPKFYTKYTYIYPFNVRIPLCFLVYNRCLSNMSPPVAAGQCDTVMSYMKRATKRGQQFTFILTCVSYATVCLIYSFFGAIWPIIYWWAVTLTKATLFGVNLLHLYLCLGAGRFYNNQVATVWSAFYAHVV